MGGTTTVGDGAGADSLTVAVESASVMVGKKGGEADNRDLPVGET